MSVERMGAFVGIILEVLIPDCLERVPIHCSGFSPFELARHSEQYDPREPAPIRSD